MCVYSTGVILDVQSTARGDAMDEAMGLGRAPALDLVALRAAQ